MKYDMPNVLQHIAKTPGVYLFKDAQGNILYIGKAKNVHGRVKSYFLKQDLDWKIAGLLADYATIETIKTKTEIEALLLEAELIKQYKPKYNTLLKSGNPFVYIFVTQDDLPDITIVRTKRKKGLYFGPFLHKKDARSAVSFLKNSFRLHQCNKQIENGCLEYHIGICAGTCRKDFDADAYLFRVQLAIEVLQNDMDTFVRTIQKKIKEYNAELAYEKARNIQKYIDHLDTIFATLKTKFSPEKYIHEITSALSPEKLSTSIVSDSAQQLQQFLGLPKPVHTIDCFDISHFQSQEIVGSCIRFLDGRPDKNKFRRFAIKSIQQQNDYAALQEIVTRCYKIDELPDVILIDGGKGQLSAVCHILPEAHIISLAKKEEILFGTNFPEGKHLNVQDPVGKTLIALRDYAHHFAISYHRLRRNKAVKNNL